MRFLHGIFERQAYLLSQKFTAARIPFDTFPVFSFSSWRRKTLYIGRILVNILIVKKGYYWCDNNMDATFLLKKNLIHFSRFFSQKRLFLKNYFTDAKFHLKKKLYSGRILVNFSIVKKGYFWSDYHMDATNWEQK